MPIITTSLYKSIRLKRLFLFKPPLPICPIIHGYRAVQRGHEGIGEENRQGRADGAAQVDGAPRPQRQPVLLRGDADGETTVGAFAGRHRPVAGTKSRKKGRRRSQITQKWPRIIIRRAPRVGLFYFKCLGRFFHLFFFHFFEHILAFFSICFGLQYLLSVALGI